VATEFKNYDSSDCYEIHNARLSADAKVITTEGGRMVKLTFASTCRNDRYETLWVEATVGDWQSGLAMHLKKGDTLGVKGKPGLRRFGDDNDKISFELIRAEIMVPPALFVELKERGFTPGADGAAKKGKPVAKKGKPASVKRTVVEVPDDDDDDEDADSDED
jgi:single-stranded DNA-binding protein